QQYLMLITAVLSKQHKILLISRTWYPEPSDCFGLRQANFSTIICSKVGYHGGFSDSGRAEALPDYVFDISRMGGLVIKLNNDPHRFPIIAPLK
ncbi:MAG: hypothetical protein U9R56_04525, partial [candidate division Zixibacteria bacterium]|nr:hypothetical protein [candidate division Zixibacteria bacterium]